MKGYHQRSPWARLSDRFRSESHEAESAQTEPTPSGPDGPELRRGHHCCPETPGRNKILYSELIQYYTFHVYWDRKRFMCASPLLWVWRLWSSLYTCTTDGHRCWTADRSWTQTCQTRRHPESTSLQHQTDTNNKCHIIQFYFISLVVLEKQSITIIIIILHAASFI